MREIAVIINGEWRQLPVIDGHNNIDTLTADKLAAAERRIVELEAAAEAQRRAIATRKPAVDQAVTHLSEVVRLAQGASETDARRIRDFVHTTSALLSATTYLDKSDQNMLEDALRATARR